MSARGTRWLAAAACLSVCGCGEEQKRLEGSLSTVLDLRYDRAELTLNEADFALRFVSDPGENTQLKLSYDLLGTAIKANTGMDLAEDAPSGGERTAVTREVMDDPRTQLPRIERGALTFFTHPESGQRTRGELHLTFEQGKAFGCGRTVFGSFEATVP